MTKTSGVLAELKHGERKVEFDSNVIAMALATGQADYVPDSMIDRLCIVGSADQCADKLRELVAVGVTYVNFYGQTDNCDEQMERYSREIIPQFRRAS